MRSANRCADDESIGSDVARLSKMLEAVQAATPDPVVIPIEQCSLLTSPIPEFRRVVALMSAGRRQKLDALGLFLADSADVPEWLARMAMNAAVCSVEKLRG